MLHGRRADFYAAADRPVLLLCKLHMLSEEIDDQRHTSRVSQIPHLLDDLEGKEPEDENSEEYSLWYGRLSATKDLIDRIEEQLNNLEDDE